MKVYQFPKNFLWGTALSAHQTEGGNTNCDWWQWEHTKTAGRKYPLEPSGRACDFYNRFQKDFELCQEFNTNAVRFSIEWARIQPAPNTFDEKEVEHYRKVILAAKKQGLRTFVTLHHFTNPIWFASLGGWQNRKAPALFCAYAKRCVQEFGNLVDAIITINEPQVYALMSYIRAIWPPNKKNHPLALLVQANMVRAHRKAFDEIKKITNVPVGIAKNIVWYETDPFASNMIDRATANVLNFLNDDLFLRPIIGKLDFLGLNYYFTARIRNLKIDSPTDYVSDLGWWINPGGLGEILKKLGKYKLPIYITENGLADAKDNLRAHFLRDMILSCAMAINDEGVDLRGYFYWSLMDNYEWHQGFWPRFGLVGIDYKNNLARKPRKSFYFYSEICKNNSIAV